MVGQISNVKPHALVHSHRRFLSRLHPNRPSAGTASSSQIDNADSRPVIIAIPSATRTDRRKLGECSNRRRYRKSLGFHDASAKKTRIAACAADSVLAKA
jgi:hypothetical protein